MVGTVSAIHFESGADVKAGTLLVELASADDVGKLQALKATAALAQITLDRDQKQFKAQGVSQQTVDADQQNLKNAQAQVVQQQATVDYKNIKAPFDGKLGIRQVDLGQYLAAGTTMVTLQSLDPIFVDFYLPQQAVAQLKVGQKVNAKIDAFAGPRLPWRDHGAQFEDRQRDPQRADPRDAEKPRPHAPAGHVCHDRYRRPAQPAAQCHAAGDGHRL